MIQPIIQYPTIPSQAFDGVVRHYDDKLYQLLDDLKETLLAHQLDGLAAYQIGSPYAVLVIKQEEDFLEIINPVIITKEGSLTPVETTAYYPGLSATTKRYQKIKLMYEDREGKQHFLTAEDDLAILLQRKTDYLLGANFRMRMSEEEKNRFDAMLEGDMQNNTAEACPSSEPKTIKNILRVITLSLIAGAAIAVLGLFGSAPLLQTLKSIQSYLLLFTLMAIIIYIFLANYEGKKYSNCTSCQIGNILGTSFIQAIRLSILGLASYFIFW